MRFRRPSPLLAGLGVALVLLLGGLAFALQASHDRSRDELEHGFDQRAKIAAQVLSSTLEQTLLTTRLADTARLSGPTVTADQIGGLGNLGKVVADARGRVIATSSPVVAAKGSNIRGRGQGVRDVLAGRPVAMNSRPGGLDFVLGIDTPYGRRISITPLSRMMIAPFLSGYLDKLRTGGGDDAYVVDRQDRILSSAPGEHHTVTLTDLRSGRYDHDGVAMYGAKARFSAPADDWQLVLATPQEELYAPVGGLSQSVPWILLAAFSALGLVALLLVRKSLRQAADLEEASRLKSDFLATMSHELRTPLNGIIGFAELMHDGRVGPVSEQHREYLGDILQSSDHLRRLIDDVLDLSKIEAGKIDLQPEPVDGPALVEAVCDIVRPLAVAKEIELRTVVDPGVGRLFLDAPKLKQVLLNYLANALKFTPERGHVTVTLAPEFGGRFRLTVADDGPGIPAEEVDRMWEAFEQLQSGSARTYGGTGLGLPLVRRIVEAQGGRVEVDSVLGEGTRFHAVLPVDAADRSERVLAQARS